MKKSNYFSLAISIAIPVLLGALSGFITKESMDSYSSLIRPPLSPPSILFPIVWTILYIAMGVSSWLIYQSRHPLSPQAIRIYGIQLIVNIRWPILFFTFHLFVYFLSLDRSSNFFSNTYDNTVLSDISLGSLSPNSLSIMANFCRLLKLMYFYSEQIAVEILNKKIRNRPVNLHSAGLSLIFFIFLLKQFLYSLVTMAFPFHFPL